MMLRITLQVSNRKRLRLLKQVPHQKAADGLDCLGHFNVFSVLNCLCCLLPGTVQEAQEQASASSKGREGSHATASWVRSGSDCGLRGSPGCLGRAELEEAPVHHGTRKARHEKGTETWHWKSRVSKLVERSCTRTP